MAFSYFAVLSSISVAIATIGLFIARWTIKQYDKAPHYTYITNTQNESGSSIHRMHKKYVYSSHALNDDESNSNIPNDDETSKLQTRLPHYQGPNPFTIKKLSTYERFKIYFFCITGIALFRFILFFVSALGIYLLSLLITICVPSNGFIHSQLIRLIRFWIGCGLFLFGFYFIDYSDSRRQTHSNNDEPIRVIVANHSTIFDGLVILWKTNGIIAAKKELSATPIFGRILNALQTLWIDRSGASGRNYAKQQIIDHANDFSRAPLVIFPQGTTSNIYTVTSFKTGAYLAKKTVLEISLNWSANKSCDLSFVGDVSALAHILHVGCCQFINYCHLNVYNQHKPNDEEQQNVCLFAENSRQNVVESLNRNNKAKENKIIATKHSYSDWRLFQSAFKSNENFNTSHFLMDDIVSNLRLRSKTVTYLAERFSTLDLNKSGYIEYDEFCSAFERDPNENSKQMQDLFNVFNTQNISMNKIGFLEFLVGVATCFMDDKIEDAVKIMFKGNEIENYTAQELEEENEEKYIGKENILNTYLKHVDESKFDKNNNEMLKQMKVFVNKVFGDNEKLEFTQFYQGIVDNKYQYMVQHYLQSIIMMRLKIKLTSNDFAIK